MSLFTDDLVVYVEDSGIHKKVTRTISELSKVAEYKINTKESNVFVYTNNKELETEIRTML